MHRRPSLKAAVVLLVLGLCTAGTSSAATITVNWDGSADAVTLADGITLANGGDTVLVAAGTYVGAANRNIDFGGLDIRLESIAGPELTIVDCESLDRGFIFASGEGPSAVVSGLTIRNGYHETAGGGILCDGASPAIENCIFENCIAWDGGSLGQGGGIYCSFSGATIADCIFRWNGAREGAGIYFADSPALVTGTLFMGNTAYHGGGGVRILRVGATVEHCTFFGNTAPVYGGGVYCCYSAPTISRCTFSENAASEGGAVYGYDASPVITDCILSFSSEGAAVYCPGASAFEISYSCLFGNAGGDEICGTGHDNIFLDPAFCDTSAGEFRLQDCSPCAGTGSGGGDIGAWGVGCACDDTTDVSDENWTRLSVSPNPTGGGARIAYQADGPERPLSLGVYTTAGRLVCDLTTAVGGTRGTVLWNGNDDSGRPVAAGVYMIQLDTETTRGTAKLVVVR